jgi:P pilus assembly chaperone PapD
MKSSICAMRAGLLALCFWATASHATIIVGTTRVVFPAQDGEVTVRLNNQGNRPALVEAWIDNGDPKSTPDKVNVPFLITPPLFRMEPLKDQSLRILATNPQVPQDRESLFWLNVLEVPPKPSATESDGKNILQFAIRSRLKLFYRPANLPGDPNTAASNVTWKSVPDGQGYALVVHNPTAYHVTFIRLSVTVDGKTYTPDLGMVDPFGDLRLTVKDLHQALPSGTPVAYDIVNDYGASASFKGVISQ